MNVSDRFQTGKQNSCSMLYQERLNIKNGDTGVGGLQEGSPRVNSELMRVSMYCPKDYGNKRQKKEVSRVAVERRGLTELRLRLLIRRPTGLVLVSLRKLMSLVLE